MHRRAIAIASHKNPIRFLTFSSGGKKIRSLVMLPQYHTDFLIAIAPEKEEQRERIEEYIIREN